MNLKEELNKVQEKIKILQTFKDSLGYISEDDMVEVCCKELVKLKATASILRDKIYEENEKHKLNMIKLRIFNATGVKIE